MRREHLQTYPECRACDTTLEVVVHHLRYRGKRGLSERPGDLVTLCRRHHDQLHSELRPQSTSVRGTIEFVARVRLVDLFA